MERPRIHIPITPAGKWMERTGFFLVLLMWGMAIFSYTQLDQTIPTHFNAAGEPDSYGNKISLFILALLGTVIFIGLTILNKYPHVFNYPVAITEENAERQYARVTGFIRFLKTIIPGVFAIIILLTYLTATGRAGGLGVWFLPGIILIFAFPTVYFIIQVFRSR